MKSTYRILFLLRKNRVNKEGLSNVAIRITIGGEAVEFNTHLLVSPHLWNPIGRLNGKTKEAVKANDALFKIRTDIKMSIIQLSTRNTVMLPLKNFEMHTLA